ncbi:type IV toxin-antitoxin system YeeU family antitoxin [Enterobacter ludwigii]|jgi:cytoskeleton bundling-enhancing protein CbeA-like protein|uniref:type IV toxin-antitoxin system YeeU family antitoxin n=1 Tax=Enterobacter cloacae complex TaxID=354276 RepID=UPI002FD49C4D
MYSEQWGLTCSKTPCFGARLVQEGFRLHFLADRAGFTGDFSNDEALRLDQAFPLIMKQLEQRLLAGELNPRHQQRVTLHLNGLTCEADTLGSHGYLYIAIYSSSTVTG